MYKKRTHFNNKQSVLHLTTGPPVAILNSFKHFPRGLGSKVRLRHLDKALGSSNESRETLEDPAFAIRTRPYMLDCSVQRPLVRDWSKTKHFTFCVRFTFNNLCNHNDFIQDNQRFFFLISAWILLKFSGHL